MNITTTPAGRFGWEGQTVEYVVDAKGATELTAPKQCADGLHVRVLDTKQVEDGVQARVAVAIDSGTLY